MAEPIQFPQSSQTQGAVLTPSTMVSPDLPEEWGGRPAGTSRRAIRMQGEWDEQRKSMLQEQQAMQQMDIQRKQFEMQARDQQLQEDDFFYNRGLQEAEQKLTTQQRSEARNIIESLNNLDPRSPDFNKSLASIFSQNSLGASDPNVQKVVEQYQGANAVYMDSQEKQSQEEEKQAQLQADVVTYNITPEQQKKMLEENLPAGVVRFDPLKALPVIAAAKQAQEAAKETKAEEKETKKATASKQDEYQKALAEYEALKASGANVDAEFVSKAEAKARGAAAVLGLPKIASDEDFKKYKSGDMVLAPNGIDIIMVP